MIDAKAIQYFSDHQSEYVDLLKRLVKMPSVSLPGFDHDEVYRCGQQVKTTLEEMGLNNVQTIDVGDPRRPYIYGDWLGAPGQPTILFYSHYDVQPIGRREYWESDPFELTEREGRLFGRGSADDKGGVVAEVAAIDSLLKVNGCLPVNIKLLIEGDEEDGSSGLDEFILRHTDKIQADAIVIVDAENFDVDTAGLTVSLRGMIGASVEIKTLKQPVHSGLFGGPLPDAAMALAKTLSTLVDDKGDINIPELNEQIRPLSEKDRKALQKMPFNEKKFREEAGLNEGVPLIGHSSEVRERLWFRPKIAINAIQAGSRAQAGNIVVEAAWAKVGLRTVPQMDTQKTFDILKSHLEKNVPFGLKVEVKKLSAGSWWQTETNHPIFEAMQRALAQGWDRESVKIGCGASIPFVQTLSEAIGGAPALLLGVADPKTQAHSENESISLDGLSKTVKSLIHFLSSIRVS